MWYGKYLVYEKDQEGKEVRRQRNIKLAPKAGTPKWKAEELAGHHPEGNEGRQGRLLPFRRTTP